MSPTQTMSATTSAVQTGPGYSPCGCPEPTPSQPCCCNLVCFDRPNYFCGHLLTDADLTLQQKYVVEKNKLYHRTMDGYGVVCGLKLTCDCDCKGNILIHDGFAIDDCGNDLIVCETTRFDVIGALKSKGLLVYDEPDDDCEPERRRSRCEIKQCFYITICYHEMESEYEAPFQSSCTTGPKQCMPTRVHEGVRFDVTEKLPPKHSYCKDLEERIRQCFELHCDSPVGVIIKRHVKHLQYILSANWDEQSREKEWCDPCELFCTLRAYFLNHLKVKPDQFNCGLYEEVSCLTCPRECYEDYDQDYDREGREHRRERREGRREESREERREERRERREEDREEEYEKKHREHYREELQEAFRKLLYYMQRYQYDCVFGDLIFNCQQPCEAHCLVLGTVEVLNGKLVRVCNTPRKYLWAPANLEQVLIYYILTGRLGHDEDCEEKKVPCCPEYHKFEPEPFLQEFEVSECGRLYAALSAIESVCKFGEAVHHACDFTDQTAVSRRLLAKFLEQKEGKREGGEFLGIRTSLSEKVTAAELSSPTPWQAFDLLSLARRGDSVVGYKSPEGIRVLPDFLTDLSPDRTLGEKLESALISEEQIRSLTAKIEELTGRLASLEEQAKKGPKKRAEE